MLLTCISCNSKYLINSADLKPNGRTVHCAICGNEWFQEPNLVDEDILKSPASYIDSKQEDEINADLPPKSNLPSTHVMKPKPSIINSILTLFFLLLLIIVFVTIKKEGIGIIVLLNYYIQEFYFNLKLIISSFAKIIYQIIN